MLNVADERKKINHFKKTIKKAGNREMQVLGLN